MTIRKNIRGITALLLALALLLCGCAKGSDPAPGAPAQPPVSSGDKSLTPSGVDSAPSEQTPAPAASEEPPYAVPHCSGKTYVPVNGLEFTTHREDADGPDDHYEGYYIQISGLKDETIEARVNARLRALYEEIRDDEGYPAIEGLQRSIETSDYTAHEKYISVYNTASIGNVLSVTGTRSESFTREDGFWLGFDDVKTLVLDLNTGNEVKYTDFFADDVHAQGAVQAAVSDAVSRGLSEPEGDDIGYEGNGEGPSALYLKDGENIGTIGADGELKYYIDEYTGNLSVVIDYDMPQFVTGYSYDVVAVPMDGIHAYDQRFYNGENIYKGDDQGYILFAGDVANGSEYNYFSEHIEHSGADIFFETSGAVYQGFPQEWNDFMELTPEQKEAMILQEEAYVDGVLGGLDPAELWCSTSYYNSASRFGDYTNLLRSAYYAINVTDPYEYINLLYRVEFASRVYYKDSAAPMELRDVFKVDCDWQTTLREAMRSSIENLEPAEVSEESMNAWLDFLMEDITGFALEGSSLVLYFDDIAGHAREFFPEVSDDDIWAFTSGPQALDYKTLGYYNLNIFR